MTGLRAELRDGVRRIARRPVWSAAIILVLALGIGANTTMFSGFDAWVMRPLDFVEPERLVAICESRPLEASDRIEVSPRNLGDFAAQQRSLAELGAFVRRRVNLDDEAEPVRLDAARISASLFPLLGKAPVRGRGFLPEEDLPGQPARVALISHALWRERYGGDPKILGRTVRLGGRAHEIVGVMEPGFEFPEWAEVWTPLGVDPLAGSREDRYLNVIGRLRPGISVSAASAELEAIAADLAHRYPESNRGWSAQATPLHEYFVPAVIELALGASLGAGLLVLVVMCANVASLLLAEAAARSRETALRTALGASRAALIRRALIEALVLAVPAGLLGAVLAHLGVRAMTGWVPVEPPYLFAMGASPRAAVYTLGVSLFAGVLCGLAPVLRHSGMRVFDELKSGGRSDTGGGRLRGALVLAQLALSTSLLIGALLMIKSVLALQNVSPGYRVEGVVTAELSVDGEGLESPNEKSIAIDRVLAQLGELGEVRTAGVTSNLPASGSHRLWRLEAEGRPAEDGEGVEATVQAIAGDYLGALEIPLLRGRHLHPDELRGGALRGGALRGGAPLALVSRGLAELLWGSSDPIGRRLHRRGGPWLEVVGVLEDLDYGRDMVSVGWLPDVQLYLPYGLEPTTSITLVVRSDSPAGPLAARLREVLSAALPGVPVSEILTMDQALFRVQWVSRFFGRQAALYAVLATVVTALGLYGLMADSVSRRTRELAVRMALGARREDLLGLVLRRALVLGALGVGAGLALSLGVTRFGAAMLHRVDVRDPGVFAGVALLLLLVVLVAAAVPARRATLLDPTAALRSE